MLRIHQVFFINVLLLFAIALLGASFISYFSLKSMIIEESKEQLIQDINLIKPQVQIASDLDTLSVYIAKNTHLRITIIDENGVVKAESDADKSTMENHLGRSEIMGAMSEPYGIRIRYSTTVKSDFIYVAHQFTIDGKPHFIRLAMNLKKVMDNFYALWLKLLLAFILLISIALIIAYNLSKKARYDIKQITHFLDEVSTKNYYASLKPQHFSEFLQISLLLKNLVKKLHHREKQKRKYTAKLKLINKQQNDILSAISHEFKNPIAAIVGYTETLEEDPNLNLAIREKFLGKVHSNALKISHMLDRLALSVKLENNDLSIKPADFDLDVLCRDVTSTLQGKYPHRIISYEGSSQEVYADKTMIDLVITNLIDNAIKYSENEVTLRLTEHTVEVIDKGIGIAPKDLELITSKFYRVQKNSWDNSMGLGLAIVSYILKLHDSHLTIDSTLGVGSTFSFSIDSFRKTSSIQHLA
ncbi:MAG: ATP-binding protein [Sulfuricurvum sp.]|nr:ATP-binding protein [Sulfuricurvum sp.]MDP3023414.1 ATP-binding protein [Sulfuricurvum sp.]MDP3119519.1 ATP-binding protein [Sulfuricurvum sp.]